MTTKREPLRSMTRGGYDLQKLRIAVGNRITANIKTRMGIDIQEKENKDSDEGKLLDEVRAEYRRITDGLVNLPRNPDFGEGHIIADYTELCLVDSYVKLLRQEQAHFRKLEGILEADFPIWEGFIKGVRGCGPAMAAVILSEVDIENTPTVAALWALAGVDVAPDGRGRSRRREHLVKRTYEDEDGNEQERDSITFNPFLKTKLVGVLADSFIKCGGPYREVYDNYKHRITNHPNHKDKSKGHLNNMARRYCVKIFLKDLYLKWREMEGLPVMPPYHERKLGLRDHGVPEPDRGIPAAAVD